MKKLDDIMKSTIQSILIVVFTVIVISIFSGCDLMTEKDQVTPIPQGNDLIINEVFTISPDKFYAYSWIELYNPTNHPINFTSIEYPSEGWAAGSGGTVLRTENTGELWVSHHTPIVPSFNGIDYFNVDTLFAVGDDGQIYRSNDHGESWFTIYVNAGGTPELNGIWVLSPYVAPNAKLLWVCGDSGTILRSIDRGGSWQKRTSGTTKNLKSIFATSITNVWACGEGVILVSSNLGTTWNAQTSAPIVNYNSIHLTSQQNGRCVGDNGIVLSTTTGGTIWVLDTSSTLSNLNSVFGLSDGRAWAVGDNGTIIKTETNNSSTWRLLPSGTNRKLNFVEFVDTLRGFVYGDDGLILYTSDGGESWTQQNSGTSEDLIGGMFLPPFKVSQSVYVLQVYGERRHIFYQPPDIFNSDFITKVDTGNLFIQSNSNLTVAAGNFVIISSDANKFDNHTDIPSTDVVIMHLNLAASFSSDRFDSIFFQALRGEFSLVKWNLLSSSELRLYKVSQVNSTLPPYEFLGFSSTLLEVVRFGDYNLAVDYPQNKPAPSVPEWWSLARYADITTTDLNTFSSDKAFYQARTPIPGWVSQLRSR